MDRILYVKYNSVRKPAYRTITEIREDTDGKKVIKRAGRPEAEAHLARMAENRELLRKAYRDIDVLEVRKEKEGLVFPFVSGLSLMDRIDTDRFDRERFVRQVNEAFEKIFAVREECRVPFAPTDGFIKVFGDRYPEGAQALCPANVDPLFSNFIETENGLACLDYEWVYDFPVPVDYLRYRVLFRLHSDYAGTLLEGFSMETVLDWFGIGEGLREVLWSMESRFQQEVHGENWRYHYLDRYRKNVVSLQAMDEEILRQKQTIMELENRYNEITGSLLWKCSWPLRKARTGIRAVLRKNNKVYLRLKSVGALLRTGPEGRRKAWKDSLREIEKENNPPGWPAKEDLREQKKKTFDRPVTFRIRVTADGAEKALLQAFIRSVRNQTRENWTLDLRVRDEAGNREIAAVCQRAAKGDQRIRYLSGSGRGTEAAPGDYSVLAGPEDVLYPSALYAFAEAACAQCADFIYADENSYTASPRDASDPLYKPDFSPDTLRGGTYIRRPAAASVKLAQAAGIPEDFAGIPEYELVLRLTEKAEKIVHVPEILCSRKKREKAADAGQQEEKKALEGHLERIGLRGSVSDTAFPGIYRVSYEITGEPLVSIVIPNKDHAGDLKKCVESIREKTTWKHWEIIIVENNSTEGETFRCYRDLEADERIRVAVWSGEFNFSGICNLGASKAKGEYILLLNNDMAVITPDWIEQMLMYAQRKDVGAVGTMLYYPDDTIQHAGVILGIGGVGGHAFKGFPRGDRGYAGRLACAQNLSAVTAACMLLPRRAWEETGGLDEGFAVAFNDVDLCMRIRQQGYLIVWTPFAELYHYESKSRGTEDSLQKRQRFNGEVSRFLARWKKELEAGDPYYNPHLTLNREDFSPRI